MGRGEEIKPTIPDYAYDKHTREGQVDASLASAPTRGLFVSLGELLSGSFKVTAQAHRCNSRLIFPCLASMPNKLSNVLAIGSSCCSCVLCGRLQAMGRGDRHFLTQATKLIPEHPDRECAPAPPFLPISPFHLPSSPHKHTHTSVTALSSRSWSLHPPSPFFLPQPPLPLLSRLSSLVSSRVFRLIFLISFTK